jgi:alpha-glucosidase
MFIAAHILLRRVVVGNDADDGAPPMSSTRPWWHRGVIYQVYPRSFADADGDGIGDLRGITARLSYLAWLGVDALWISPIYPSPMADFGYDITDHKAVDPTFGSLEDFRALIAEARRVGLRVLLDYVPNHTSIDHPWFAESRASRSNPRRDWYLWRDPGAGGAPPNNWRSAFGGSAWTLDPASGQFYYHAYLPEQPDLNWRNPQVREAMLDVLRFWLREGVDGFRIDALRQLLKDPRWRENPPNPAYRPGMPPYEALLPVHSADLDEIHEPIAAMRAVLREYGGPLEERLLIGELYLPIERLVRYYGAGGGGVQLPTNMHLIACPWTPEAIADLIERYETALPANAWPNWVLGNHDRRRVGTRVGRAQARVAAMLLLTLRGTPILYYGDEVGMIDVPIPHDRARDPYEHRVPGEGRDPQRTPMQWSSAPHAGFCPAGAEPWLPVAEDHRLVNVAAQRRDPRSMLALCRRLLALRRDREALTVGNYATVTARDGVLAYTRRHDEEQVLVALNLSDSPRAVALKRDHEVLLSTRLDREGERAQGELQLRAGEGVLLSQSRRRRPDARETGRATAAAIASAVPATISRCRARVAAV